MKRNSAHKNKELTLTYSELNNKYIRLKYEFEIHRRKTRVLYEECRNIHNKYWDIYDFISARAFDNNEDVNNNTIKKECCI